MAASQDLMERLAAADPATRERLTPDQEAEADQLLEQVLATPADTGRGPRRRLPLRRWSLATAGAACVVAAAVAAVDLLDSDGGPAPNVIDKAVAALTRDGSIYHTVELVRSEQSGTGRGTFSQSLYVESWYGTDRSAHTKFFDLRDGRRGKLRSESAGGPVRLPSGKRTMQIDIYNADENVILQGRGFGVISGSLPYIDTSGDPGASLKQLERRGRIRVAGTTRVDGKPAYRLVSGPVRVPNSEPDVVLRFEYVVDAKTYFPLRSRVTQGRTRKLTTVTRFLVYERLPLNARTRRLLELDPHPGAKVLGDRDLPGRSPAD